MEALEVDVRVIAAEAVIDSIEAALLPTGFTGERSTIVDPSYLGLDLSTVADVAGLISVAALSDPLLPMLWHWLRPSSPERTRIVVETPFGRAVFDSRDELTEDEVRIKLERLIGVVK